VSATESPSSSSSLDPLETIAQNLQMSRAQVRLFDRDVDAREAVLVAFGLSENAALLKRAQNIGFCCHSPQVLLQTDGKPCLSLQACRDRMCPRCQRARGGHLKTKVAALVAKFNAPRLLTLTLRNHPEGELSTMLDRLSRNFRCLRASPFWKEHVIRGCYTIEVTFNKASRTWHAHLHAITDGGFMRQAALSDLWKSLTGDSSIVDIRAINDRDKSARYISSYVAKPIDGELWEAAQVVEFALATRGRRMVHTFGKAHGKAIDPPETEDLPKLSSPLCSLRDLVHSAGRGVPQSMEAVSLIPRMGKRWCHAAGLAFQESDVGQTPVTDPELFAFVEACQAVVVALAFVDSGSMPPPLPQLQREPKSVRDDPLIDVAPRFCN